MKCSPLYLRSASGCGVWVLLRARFEKSNMVAQLVMHTLTTTIQ